MSLHFEPMVLASRLNSWIRKSSFRPVAPPLASISRSWPMWLRRRTVSSSTATLSAKMAASVRMRAGSSWVLASTSFIRASSLARYSATVWGERFSTSDTLSSMAAARDRMSSFIRSPSRVRIWSKSARARSRTEQMSFAICSTSSSAFSDNRTSGKRDSRETEISSDSPYSSASCFRAA